MRPSALRQADDVIRTIDPELAPIVGGVAIVAALAALWTLVRWFRRSPGARFRRTLAEYDRVDVLMHPNPDPDAMSSALAVETLADSVDTESRLVFPGRIRHQENRAFRTVLDLELDRIESASDLSAEAVVLVDHNEPRGFRGVDEVDPVAVIDHHPGGGSGREFTDVRPRYGACATILTEYLRDVGARPVGGDEDGDASIPVPWETATGLLYGIQADTDHLTRGCTMAEFDACAFLFPGVDEGALDRIANPQVSADVLETKARAIRDRDVRGSFAVARVGRVSNVDAIPQAADELLYLEGVTAVVVYGRHDGTVHLSGRSRDDRVHMGDILSAAVEDLPRASAGGHARMGGGQVSVAPRDGGAPGDTESLSDLEFTDRLFEAMAGGP